MDSISETIFLFYYNRRIKVISIHVCVDTAAIYSRALEYISSYDDCRQRFLVYVDQSIETIPDFQCSCC